MADKIFVQFLTPEQAKALAEFGLLYGAIVIPWKECRPQYYDWNVFYKLYKKLLYEAHTTEELYYVFYNSFLEISTALTSADRERAFIALANMLIEMAPLLKLKL